MNQRQWNQGCFHRGVITRAQADQCFENENMSSCYETFFKMDTMELDRRIWEVFAKASQVPFFSVAYVKSFLSWMGRELDIGEDDIVKQQRVMFLLLKRHFHICAQPDILSCPNRDLRGICDHTSTQASDNSEPHRKKRKLTSMEEETLSKFAKNPDVSSVARSQNVPEDVVFNHLTSCLENGEDVEVRHLGVDAGMLQRIEYEWHQDPETFADLVENPILLSPKVDKIQENLESSGLQGITKEKVKVGLAACKRKLLF